MCHSILNYEKFYQKVNYIDVYSSRGVDRSSIRDSQSLDTGSNPVGSIPKGSGSAGRS